MKPIEVIKRLRKNETFNIGKTDAGYSVSMFLTNAYGDEVINFMEFGVGIANKRPIHIVKINLKVRYVNPISISYYFKLKDKVDWIDDFLENLDNITFVEQV